MKKWLALLLLLPALGLAETIEPVPENIEAIWDIQDAREETDGPLTDRLLCGGGQLGYDAASDTFFCPIDPGSEDWPELSIEAETGISLIWTDDHTADSPADAMAEGLEYRVMQYDGGRFHESAVVFTGLPVLTIRTEGDPESKEDIAAGFTASGGGMTHAGQALIHTRGSGAWHGIAKPSWHLELRTERKPKKDNGKEKKTDKTKKEKVSLLGMPEDSEWLLLGNAADHVTVSNLICFGLWRDWGESGKLGSLESRMAELFVNNEYMGVYQVMQRMRPKEQIEAAGLPEGTVSARLVKDREAGKRALLRDGETAIELRRAPGDLTDEAALAAYGDFITLYRHADELSDAEFAALAEKCFDMDELMRYFIFVHVTQNRDNLGNGNNVYIWAEPAEDGYRYHLTPWDMDGSLVCRIKHLEEGETDYLDGLEMIGRMIELDAGSAHAALRNAWDTLSQGAMDASELCARMSETAEMMNASGAWRRECARWRAEPPEGEWWLQEARRWEEEESGEMTLQTQMDFVTGHLLFLEERFSQLWGTGK